MSSELRNISSYVPLDNYYKSFTYITGPDFTNNKYTLEIDGNIIKNWSYRNETLMECFCELGLFGRWHWEGDTTALLYFEKQRQLDNAKSFFGRKYEDRRRGIVTMYEIERESLIYDLRGERFIYQDRSLTIIRKKLKQGIGIVDLAEGA
ncbi:6066_t:CDS:2, partial [Funneliformis geosporum]